MVTIEARRAELVADAGCWLYNYNIAFSLMKLTFTAPLKSGLRALGRRRSARKPCRHLF